jgi:hypothetical protein
VPPAKTKQRPKNPPKIDFLCFSGFFVPDTVFRLKRKQDLWDDFSSREAAATTVAGRLGEALQQSGTAN